jgi:RNase H-fold protein (predicted Holliday junction resolvase)
MGIMDIEDVQSIEGEDEASEKVERFVLNILESVEMDGSDYTFNLFQHGRGGEEDDPVFSTEFKRKRKDRDFLVKSAQELAQEIVGEATSDVENFLEETPNKKGLLSQLMRHQEKVMKLAVGATKNVIDMQNRTIREAQERVKQLEERQVENIRLTEELVSGAHARNIEIRRIEKKEKRMDEIAGMVMQGAPMLLQMVAASGVKAGGGEAQAVETGQAAQQTPARAPTGSRIEQLVEVLLGTFTQEQMMKMQASGLFAPEQLMTLIEIAREIDAKNKASASATPENGETDKP